MHDFQFISVPSLRKRQKSEFGNRLQLTGFNCTGEPSLGVTWAWECAEKENFLLGDGVPSGF